MARQLEKDRFIAAIGTMFFIGSIPLLIGYMQNGLIDRSVLITSALLIPPTLAGFYVGEKLRARLPTERFRLAVLVMFLLIGLNLLRRAFF